MINKIKNWLWRVIFPNGDGESFALLNEIDAAEATPVLFYENRRDHRFDPLIKINSLGYSRDVALKIKQRLIALKYRLEGKNGGLDPLPGQSDHFIFLWEAAGAWKRAHPLMGKKILSPKEIFYLKKTAEYPAFIALLKEDRALKDRFFEWVLRDENEPVPFIEFPAMAEMMVRCNLSGRISRYPNSNLRIDKFPVDGQSAYEKYLMLPFEGHYRNILDLSATVQFRGQYTLTIGEIFEVFANKEIAVGNFEYMKEGFTNWNIHHLGYWDAEEDEMVKIKMEHSRWWDQLPASEVLNKREIYKRYGLCVKSNEWVAAAVATRGRANLDYEETHAFLELAIPQENGKYSIYDFGKLALQYPKNRLERIMMMTKTVHATIAYPDDNIFFTHRQRGTVPFVLKARQGRKLMSLICADILSSRDLKETYQIQSENCAKWVHGLLEKVIGKELLPDLFKMQLLDTEPNGAVASIFKVIKKLPNRYQVPVLMFLHLPLGAFRKIGIVEEGKIIYKSLSTHSFFKTGQIFLPALLVYKEFKRACVHLAQVLKSAPVKSVSFLIPVISHIRLFSLVYARLFEFISPPRIKYSL